MEQNEKEILQKYGLEKVGSSFTTGVLNKIEELEEQAFEIVLKKGTMIAPESLSANVMQSIATLEQQTKSAHTYKPIEKTAAAYVPLILLVLFSIFLFLSASVLPEINLSSAISSYANHLDSLMSGIKTNLSSFALSILCALGVFSMLLFDGVLEMKKTFSITP